MPASNDIHVERQATQVIIQATIHDKLPRLGSRWLDMYTCQPPVTEMGIYANCCSRRVVNDLTVIPETTPPLSTLSVPRGIRVRNLLAATEPYFTGHRLCRNARAGILRVDGTVRVHVTFQGVLNLGPDDPFLAWRNARKHESRLRQ